MNLVETEPSETAHEAGGYVKGVAIALVTQNKDEDGLCRVKVSYPWHHEPRESYWARLATPMAGKERGLVMIPEVGDEVLVAFEREDLRFPYVLGALWNGKDAPPATNSDGKNNVRIIQSRSGHVVKLNDEDGKETIEIIDKSGNNSIVIDTAHNTLRIIADKDIELTAKETIKLTAKNVEISSSETTKIEAKQGMDVKASGELNVKGSKVNIN
jgi:uncharacterized protein involved in type VI secretion and phage assembly